MAGILMRLWVGASLLGKDMGTKEERMWDGWMVWVGTMMWEKLDRFRAG